MIQDISAEFDRTYLHRPPQPQDPVICCRRGTICVSSQEPLTFPTASEFDPASLTYLFRVDGASYYLAQEEPAGEHEWLERRALRAAVPQPRAFAGITGLHLHYWYTHTRFCGRCGQPMQPSETERAMVCPACGDTVYPTIAPAVIIGVVRQGSILVSHYAGRPYTGLALLAGYCEIGETPEDTVRREVMEEVGLRVTSMV